MANEVITTQRQQHDLASEMPDPLTELRDQTEAADRLLLNIKRQLPKLEKLLAEVEGHWGIEDGFYRFYHQSFKVYQVQGATEEVCKALQELLPDYPMNPWFCKITADGTGREFELSHNQAWLTHTRPVLEAFFHAHFFLKMIVKYGREFEDIPNRLPSGWAAVLCLFNLR
jgi:hypothetical protein